MPRDLPRIDPGARADVEPVSTDARADVGKIEAPGEMFAMREDKADAHLRVVVENPVRGRKLLQQLEVGGVALISPVEADEQNVTIALYSDAGFGGWSCHATSLGSQRADHSQQQAKIVDGCLG